MAEDYKYYHCMHCNGVWENGFDKDYIGKRSEIEIEIEDYPTYSCVCNQASCQEKNNEWIKGIEEQIKSSSKSKGLEEQIIRFTRI